MSNPLPNTSIAVLGILSHQEALSGYEVRKRANHLRYFYWSPAQSQIYSELKRLLKLEYVTEEYVVQSGKPNKKLYQITSAGLDLFREWINQQPAEPTVLKHGLALQLYFGHIAEPGRLQTLLERFIDQTQASLAQVSIVEEFTSGHPETRYQSLVAEWGRRHFEAELDTAEQILKRLQSDEFTDPTYWDN